jgi:hypothetical protein
VAVVLTGAACPAGEASLLTPHVAHLIRTLADNTSVNAASVMPEALSHLLATFDACSSSLHTVPLAMEPARRALATASHVLGRQLHSLAKRQPELGAAPVGVAARLALLVAALAAAEAPAVTLAGLEELLGDFFDMQRVVCAAAP